MTEEREQCDCPTCGRIHWKMPFTRSDGGPIPKIGKSLLGPTIKVGLNNDGANLSQNEHVALRARVAQLEAALRPSVDLPIAVTPSHKRAAFGQIMMADIWVVWRDCGKHGILPLNAFVYEAVASNYLETVKSITEDPDKIFMRAHNLEPFDLAPNLPGQPQSMASPGDSQDGQA